MKGPRRWLPLALPIIGLPLMIGAVGLVPQSPPLRNARLVSEKPDEPTTLVFPTFLHTWGLQRARPAHLRLFLGDRTRFADPQDLAVTVLDAWDDPAQEGDDDEVTVYGINAGRGEIIYNTSMFTLGLYGRRGEGEGQFRDPHGIDADPAGNVVVADTGNDRVSVLFNDGRLISHRRQLTAVAPGDSLSDPYDVALTPDEGVWVSDSGNARLVLFGLDGSVRRTIDTAPLLGRPGAIALAHPDQRWSYFREYAIYVTSRDGSVLLKLDREGAVQARAEAADTGARAMALRYLAVDFYANVWATDGIGSRVIKFDRNLAWLDNFGSRGQRDRQFEDPRGIAIWRRFGQTFVTEQQGAQYYWIGSDARQFQAIQSEDRLLLDYRLTEFSYVTVRARFTNGGFEEFFRRRFRPPGPREETLRMEGGRQAAWIEIVVEPTYSSYTYREKVFELRF
jgi:sugar lactone lactonase YvrE